MEEPITKEYQGYYRKVYLSIYNGVNSMSEIVGYFHRLGLDKSKFVVIKFMNKYYGVAFDGITKEVMLGEHNVWYRKNMLMYETTTKNFRLPYKIKRLTKTTFFNQAIAYDLMTIDPNLQLYHYRKTTDYYPTNITKYQYALTYLILLGLTFYDEFHGYYDYYINLKKYFEYGLYHKIFLKHPDIIGINPFKSQVKFKDGTVKKWRFY